MSEKAKESLNDFVSAKRVQLSVTGLKSLHEPSYADFVSADRVQLRVTGLTSLHN